MALTETALKALKPRDKPYTLADERGLYIEVFPTGGIGESAQPSVNSDSKKDGRHHANTSP